MKPGENYWLATCGDKFELTEYRETPGAIIKTPASPPECDIYQIVIVKPFADRDQ